MTDGWPATTSAQATSIAGFLSPAECRDLIGQIDAAHQQRAEIWIGNRFGVHPESRLGSIAQLPTQAEVLVQDRLWDLMPELERRFACEVSHLSGVTALIYGRGDHFAAHSDGGLDEEAPPEVRRRRVSLIVALNDGSSERPDFRGGELHLYPGSAPNSEPRLDHVARMRSRPGLLIAFPSPMVHRVTAVIDGRRYSLALWALAPPER